MPVITNIEDLRVLAEKRVPRMFYDYADSGSWTEGTYRANEADFQKIKLRQRVAVNMENRTTATKMVGLDVKMPVAIAPVGLTGMQSADGEIKAARAAEKFGIPFILSTMSICSMEDVAAATNASPPKPTALASVAAHNRRTLSSRNPDSSVNFSRTVVSAAVSRRMPIGLHPADADHRARRPGMLAPAFHQDAAQLGATGQQIVGPLHTDTTRTAGASARASASPTTSTPALAAT